MPGSKTWMENGLMDSRQYRNKRILVTGHTGFKGGWLSYWLQTAGAEVTGIALPPKTDLDFFKAVGLESRLDSRIADIRNLPDCRRIIRDADPELIFHLAAQPIVLESYKVPVETLHTNIIGTANILEAARDLRQLKGIIVITSDKCYHNNEWVYAYRENDRLGGKDPYSASKACAEIVSQSYSHAFFEKEHIPVATVRAGNVIGGGDWQDHRLIPDFMRCIRNSEVINIRNPEAVRHWQHVLEPLAGYLMLGEKFLQGNLEFSGAWNFGPGASSSLRVIDLAEKIVRKTPGVRYKVSCHSQTLQEANLLLLESKKAERLLNWKTGLDIDRTLDYTFDWYFSQMNGENTASVTSRQIEQYTGLINGDEG